MTVSDSIFLFEIVAKKLLSFVSCKEFCIRIQFADIFELDLRDANDLDPFNTSVNSCKKTKVRNVKNHRKTPLGGQVQSGVVFFTGSIETLIQAMKNFPFKASLYNKDKPNRQLGSTYVPWSPVYIDYLHDNYFRKCCPPAQVSGDYIIYDKITSKRVATITLKIKLSQQKDKLITCFRSLSVKNQSNITKKTSSYNNYKSIEKIGVIKTVYGGRKRKMKVANRSKTNKKEPIIQEKKKPNGPPVETQDNIDKKFKLKKYKTSVAKSDTDLVKNRRIEVFQTNSCSNMSRKRINILNYIFGDSNRAADNRTYCVGYFTVKNDLNKDARSKEISTQGKTSDKSVPQVIENVVGGMKAKLNFNENECFCSCECTIGIVKHTTYCKYCGGFEIVGDDISKKNLTTAVPCPIYHNYKKKKPLKSNENNVKNRNNFQKKKRGSKSSGSDETQASGEAVNTETEEGDEYKGSKKEIDRFKFNYGFTGIPVRIGHSKCGLSCGEKDHSPVPKDKGWLWTAENVPGLKFRPTWRPGAARKNVVRLLKIAKNPGIAFSKRKGKYTEKEKKPHNRPLLTVSKKDGEYTVTMETSKIYPKPRLRNQQPYEDKPLLTYTVGRTEEENRERLKKKEREQRHLERDKREFIQSEFSNMCKDICLKTYQQVLGILPGAEDPDCSCYPKEPGADDINLDQTCSCSSYFGSSSSDTDSDEWILEFTPPNAIYNPTYKPKKVVKVDDSTQYTYLDYRVKLLDRNGNQVPRFFKGPDGKTQCSDLGGFWSPDHKWLVINSDGYIGPDGRWAPMIFIGPNGDRVECYNGKFQVAYNKWLDVGVDGYVDNTGIWKYYDKPKVDVIPKKLRIWVRKRDSGNKRGIKGTPCETTGSSFGDTDPKDIAKKGISGHGNDKKLLLTALQEIVTCNKDVQIPQRSAAVPRYSTGKQKRQTTST